VTDPTRTLAVVTVPEAPGPRSKGEKVRKVQLLFPPKKEKLGNTPMGRPFPQVTALLGATLPRSTPTTLGAPPPPPPPPHADEARHSRQSETLLGIKRNGGSFQPSVPDI
jgi:hypothetical protein